MTTYVVASALCAISTSIWMLIHPHVTQEFGGIHVSS